MHIVLRKFEVGRLFRLVFPWLLRLVALLLLVYGIYFWIRVWIEIRGKAEVIIATVFFQLLFLALLYALIHTILIRSNDIARLPEGDYPAIAVSCLLLRLMGELFLILMVFTGLVGCVAIWLVGPRGLFILEGIPLVPTLPDITDTPFLMGVLFLAIAVVTGVFYLLLFYLLPELLQVVVDIFRNTRAIREKLEQRGWPGQ